MHCRLKMFLRGFSQRDVGLREHFLASAGGPIRMHSQLDIINLDNHVILRNSNCNLLNQTMAQLHSKPLADRTHPTPTGTTTSL
jgi:hypothetical protein